MGAANSAHLFHPWMYTCTVQTDDPNWFWLLSIRLYSVPEFPLYEDTDVRRASSHQLYCFAIEIVFGANVCSSNKSLYRDFLSTRPTRLGEPPPVSLLLWSRGGLVIGNYEAFVLVDCWQLWKIQPHLITNKHDVVTRTTSSGSNFQLPLAALQKKCSSWYKANALHFVIILTLGWADLLHKVFMIKRKLVLYLLLLLKFFVLNQNESFANCECFTWKIGPVFIVLGL